MKHFKRKRLITLFLIATTFLLLCGCGLQATTPVTANAVQPEAVSTTISAEGELKVVFLDVGQGNAQLILTPNGKTMLIDGGNNSKEDEMFAYLNQYNVKKIDVLIGSHPDADHIGTLPELIEGFEIGSIYLPKVTSNTKTFEALLLSIKNKGLKVNTAKAGIVIPLDDELKVDLLGPVNTYDDSNEMSAVVKVTFGEFSFLFPGDAEYESEQDMLKAGVDLSADVLAVGHHGSNSSSNLAFLKKVNPKYGVIQVGADNRYGHPTDKTLQKLKELNIKTLRTDENGTITFTTDGNTVNVTTEK
jgi:beta-lactamase superfamily II metal-dependent hydrolase